MAEGQHLCLDTGVIALALDWPSGVKHLHLSLPRQRFCWGQHNSCAGPQRYVHRGVGFGVFHWLAEVTPSGGRPSRTEATTLSLPWLLLYPWKTASLDTSLGASQGQMPWGWAPPPLGNVSLLGFSALLLPKCSDNSPTHHSG